MIKFGNNNIGTLGSLVLLKAIDHIKSQVEYLNIEVKDFVFLEEKERNLIEECSYQ
jgi:hypothetical protein